MLLKALVRSILVALPRRNYMQKMKARFRVCMFTVLQLHAGAAHMVLEWPKPYGAVTLTNSPLEPSGLDFPCKLRPGVYDIEHMNYWTAGEAQSIRFKGSAVHGGGSCQFSVTTDLQPTKATQWKVLHSVVGGCPASASGNLEGGSEAHTADSFNVVLPDGMPTGRYTFAWTWFNRMGLREMYMNCAPVEVDGGTDNATLLDSLPDMFVVNLPSTDCSTVENFDLAFPNPGASAITAEHAEIASTLVGTGCASVTRLGAGDGTMHHLDAATQGLSVQSRAADDASNTAVEGLMIFSQSIQHEAASVAANAVSTKDSMSLVVSDLPSARPTSTGSACIPCSEGDDVVCIDEKHFGLCNGICALPQLLAVGTFCSNGSILKRSVRPSPFVGLGSSSDR